MTTIASIQPLFPENRVLDRLIESAGQLISECQKLARLDDKPIAVALVPLLRSMNSYYTNKIEGQHTPPAKIEAALRKEYLADASERQAMLQAKSPGRQLVESASVIAPAPTLMRRPTLKEMMRAERERQAMLQANHLHKVSQ